MKRRHYVTIVYYLLGRRFGLLDLQSRARKVIKALSIPEAALCTCALPRRYKDLYNEHINDARRGTPRFRTAGST